MRLQILALPLLGALAVSACSESTGLLRATVANDTMTVTLGALHGTPVSVPSGFETTPAGAGAVSDLSSFDFVYDVDSVLGPALYGPEVLKVFAPSATNPGLKPMSVPFDSISRADLNGYITDEIVPIDSGDVLLSRSAIRCSVGVPLYAKIEVLGIDTTARTVTLRTIADLNCGYRGLLPGIPKH